MCISVHFLQGEKGEVGQLSGIVVALPNDDAPERWVYVPGMLSPSRVALAISERHRAALSRLLFAIGHVAIKMQVHIEECDKELAKGRGSMWAQGTAVAPEPAAAAGALKAYVPMLATSVIVIDAALAVSKA